MLLAKEFVAYLSRQVVTRLTPAYIETSQPGVVAGTIDRVIVDELMVEDRLNDEVREILGEYSDYMRREGVSYQEMIVSSSVSATGNAMFATFQNVFACVRTAPLGWPVVPDV